MFKAKKFLILFGAAILALLSSCNFNNLQKKSATLVFDFTSVSGKVSTAARSTLAEVIEENETCYLDLEIQGGFEYNQTINLKETQIIQITDIPVGARITALADLYTLTVNEDDATETKTLLYQGKSKGYTIIAGENNIQIPLKKYKPADDPAVDPDDEKDPAEDPNDPNSGNVQEPEPDADAIIIYVKYDPDKQNLSTYQITTSGNYPTEDDKDGKTPETAFGYIQSAIDWIANNGNGNTDYKILLTKYGDTPFDQGMYFTDSIGYGNAKSIFLSSDNKDEIALKATTINSIIVATRVPVILRNIKVSTATSTDASDSSLILNTKSGSEVTLSKGTRFESSDAFQAVYGSAIYMDGGSVYMKEDATITGFYTKYKGGAVYIDGGDFTMEGNSEISYCHTTSKTDGGGAVYLATTHSYLTLKENASIINCSSDFNAGAVYVYSGSFTMDSGLITGCTAGSKDKDDGSIYGGYGGAIYLSRASTNTYAYLNGGTISSNTAKRQGGAIYIDSSGSRTATLEMKGNICIDPETDNSNDIFNGGSAIQISDSLTTENETVALVTYNKGTISEGGSVLQSSNSEALNNGSSKFKTRIWDYTNEIYDNDWGVNTEGKLAPLEDVDGSTIKLYVKYDDNKQGLTGSQVSTPGGYPTENDKDGLTPNTAFNYIQSAIDWIANNGNGDKNYKIYLTNYGDDPFDQGMYFTDTITSAKAKSIILTSEDKEKTAIRTSSPYSITVHTSVPVIFRNIKVSTVANSHDSNSSLILNTKSGAEVTLDKGTLFESSNTYLSLYGGAVYMTGGTVFMKNDAQIKGFYAAYGGGAVYMKGGNFYMCDNSVITDCHTTASDPNDTTDCGGAFNLQTSGSHVYIQGNASITDCSSKRNGGAIYVLEGGVTMESGTISGCRAEAGNGGAIYLSTKSANVTAALSGGTISNNTASSNGGAIYIMEPYTPDHQTGSYYYATVSLSGSIFIDPSSEANDIYNSFSDTKGTIPITLSGTLTTTNEKAALITYDEGRISAASPVIQASDPDIITNSCSKIKVRVKDPNGYAYGTVDTSGNLVFD